VLYILSANLPFFNILYVACWSAFTNRDSGLHLELWILVLLRLGQFWSIIDLEFCLLIKLLLIKTTNTIAFDSRPFSWISWLIAVVPFARNLGQFWSIIDLEFCLLIKLLLIKTTNTIAFDSIPFSWISWMIAVVPCYDYF
jgi:hypothetical protein